MWNRRLIGVSLAEAVVALFLLTAAMLVVINLFHQGLRHQARAARISAGSAAAENLISEIRAWATSPANFRGAWAAYDGQTRTVDGLTLQVDCEPRGQTIYSPCEGLEAAFLTDSRRLDQSVVPVTITVTEGTNRLLAITTEVCEPPRPTGLLEVTPVGGGPNPVPPGGELLYQAVLRDDGGAPLEDVFFHWSVEPVPPAAGNGRVYEVERTGKTARLRNEYYFNPYTSNWTVVAGTVRVRVRARYQGQDFIGYASPVELAP